VKVERWKRRSFRVNALSCEDKRLALIRQAPKAQPRAKLRGGVGVVRFEAAKRDSLSTVQVMIKSEHVSLGIERR
jgi:hypothetical protein